ncbi:hypothetical protein Pint_02354 [Pistacia integerrima]|uniref:Uncharacterized protein n=1 Tax=Pistacia integerrima TaxID=434235 RepID=A0ACC0ZPC5_9ROSI|nr:hypothetical protein Pint_02354 [Pistacia integerrima]
MKSSFLAELSGSKIFPYRSPSILIMGSIHVESASELLEAQALVWNYSLNYVNCMSVKYAIQLGISDIIHKHGQPMTLSQIVSALGVNPNKAHGIHRLMRVLVLAGFFSQQKVGKIDHQEDKYFLTPSSRLLLKDAPFRAAPFVFLILDPLIVSPFHSLSAWFKNDDSTPFETTNGKNFWGCVADEPKFKNTFYHAMVSDSQLVARVLIEDHREVFKGLKSLVDVGGGTGTMAEIIANAFPEIQCTVFYLPHVVDNLQGTKNLNFLGGDMFKAIPSVDAVLLKWILHDWGDEESLKILERCREAIPSKEKGGKVIIIDLAIGMEDQSEESTETQLCFDMLMMSLFNTGKERSVEEWKKLFLEAGFTHYKITPILGLRSLIELYP